MNEFDREIEAALRHRAESVQSHPLGFGDVSRRIVRRRRRSASVAMTAIALPALAGVGWVVARPEPAGQAVGGPDTTVGATTAVAASIEPPGMWACTGPVLQTTTVPADPWSYFEYCEAVGFAATTMPMPTTTTSAIDSIDVATLLDRVLFVDASVGGFGVPDMLAGQMGMPPRHLLRATRPVEQTMAMPTGADVSAAYEIVALLGIGGFDTWTPDLIDGELPDGIAVVIVIGEDWFDRTPPPQTTLACSFEGVASTTTSMLGSTSSEQPTSTLAPTTTIGC